MSALMSDVIEGAVTPGICNAAVNAGGKLLKVVELQIRYGTASPRGRHLALTGEPHVLADLPPVAAAVPAPDAAKRKSAG